MSTSVASDRDVARVLVTVLPAAVLVPIASTVVAITLPAILADLALGTTAIWWLVTGYLLLVALLQVPGGRLTDVIGARRTLLGATALLALASFGAAVAAGATALVAARLGQGAAAAVLVPAGLATLRRHLADADRARAVGIFTACLAGGAVIGIAAGGVLVSAGGWRAAFAALAVAAAAALIPTAFVPHAPPTPPVRSPEGPSPSRTTGRGDRTDWHRPAARIALASLAFYVVLLVVPIRLDGAGWSGAAAGLLVGLFALGAALGALATDPLRRRLGPHRTLQLLVGVAAGALLTIAVAPTTGILLGPLLLLAGTALGAILTGGFTSGLDRTAAARAGAASGRLSLARYIGSIVGTALLPPLLVTTGVTGALVVAVAALLAVPMTQRATPDHS